MLALTGCLDEAAAARVTALTESLAWRGITEAAGTAGYRPHLTFTRAAEAAAPRLPALAAIPIRLEALALFGGASAVLWLAPVPSTALLEAQRVLHAAMPGDAQYRPEAWVPHVTLAEGLTPAQASAAIAALLPAFTPIAGWLDRLELVEFPPVQVRKSVPLSRP